MSQTIGKWRQVDFKIMGLNGCHNKWRNCLSWVKDHVAAKRDKMVVMLIKTPMWLLW